MATAKSALKTVIKPLDDRIVVARTEPDAKSSGGIILPENAKEKMQQGKILAVGPGKLLDDGSRAKPDVSVGDVILFGKYSGQTVKVDGDELLVMKEEDLFAVVEK